MQDGLKIVHFVKSVENLPIFANGGLILPYLRWGG